MAAPSQHPSASFCVMGVATASQHPQTCEGAVISENKKCKSIKLTSCDLSHFCTVVSERVGQRRVRRWLDESLLGVKGLLVRH